MKAMSNKEIQSVDLELLKEIDSYCRENGIRYFLDSGTLIGAARDGEFILWDDDADVVMPRPDFERFVTGYLDSTTYKLYAPSRRNCYLPYARLCEMKKTWFGQKSRWTRDDPGVGVDIFPLDGAPDSLCDYDKLANRIVKVRNHLWRLRSDISRSKIVFRKSVIGFIKDSIHYMVSRVHGLCPEFFIRRDLSKIRRLRLRYSYEDSKNCFYIVVTGDRRKYWRKEWFSEVTYLKLCGELFPAPKGYAQRLHKEYGDWRTPPPESERSGHANCQTMYWRDR